MNTSNTLIMSLCFLVMGAATGTAQDAAPQDTIPPPLGETLDLRLAVEQWVQPTADGLLIGQITTVDDGPIGRCDIALVGTDDAVHQFSSDEQGKVTFRDIPPGVYALVVRGENLVATYALQVIGPDMGNLDRDATFAIGAARVDVPKFYGQVVRSIPAGRAPAYSLEPAEVEMVIGKIGPPALSTTQQVDGGMEGCLYTAGVANGQFNPAPETHIFLLQDGLEVARAVTDEQGCYRIENMAPGRYSFIAVGQSGIAATGIKLVVGDATVDAGEQETSFKLASAAQPGGATPPGQLNLQLAPPQAALRGFEAMGPPPGASPFGLPPAGLLPPPGFGGGFAGGGGMGGGFGGGGAGGGGGDLGGLLGAAGLAAGIAALADDDDFVVPTPASPPVPAP